MRILIAGATVSLDPKAVLPDEVIDYWGRVYEDTPGIRLDGISFEAFLARPGQLVKLYRLERRGLLPVQRAIQARVDRLLTA